MSILIVDDSPYSRGLLVTFLNAAGYKEVFTAASGHVAFECLGMNDPDSGISEYDLILMDIAMPDTGGVEACRRIKATTFLRDIPIIIVTGSDKTQILDEAFSAGAMDFITKPVNNVELLARMRSALTLKREMDARKRALLELERQFLQAQKLESMGRLAGGIAHDFSNLLTAVMGYTQMQIMELPAGDRMRSNLEGIQRAAERASTLTRQLLALSRSQVTDTKVIDANHLVTDISKMLRRVIGENIELVVLLAEELDFIKADPGQIEQVLMNLAVNSRDAMPDGGKLTIETVNLTLAQEDGHQHVPLSPGKYVMLSVRDTGTGMTEEIRARIFEPFFTTKEEGKGTGLGLATSYGILSQIGGHLDVQSDVGCGAAFNLYLPCVEESVATLPDIQQPLHLPRGTETILLVEDEPLVRKRVAIMLHGQGYTVIQANNGEEALRALQQHAGQELQLLLSDVVMPQMSGTELADRMRTMHPDIRVLLTSGYSDGDFDWDGDSDTNRFFLQKPFPPSELACKVREVLDV